MGSRVPIGVLLHDVEVSELYVHDKIERLAAYHHNNVVIDMLEGLVGPNVVRRSLVARLCASPTFASRRDCGMEGDW